MRDMERYSESAEVIRQRQERVRFRCELAALLRRIILLGAAAWLLLTQVFVVTQAQGQGMFPAIKDGDLVLAFCWQRDYQKDDVLLCTVDGQNYIGRLAAGAGDVVTITEEGTLLVNGTVQSGEILYPTYPGEVLTYPYRVPEGCVFLLGDYRTEAADSREFAAVPLSQVRGKVLTILRRRAV